MEKIHSRDAAEDTLSIVREYMQEGMSGGIIHCFSYGKEMAREYLNMGLFLGIGGVVTFKNAKKLKEVVTYAPLSQLVLETDCPYMSPEPYRGKRIGGVVTFKNAKKLKEVVTYAPLSQLVLETDCPYMSPEPYRGKRNSSLNLPYVAQAIGELKGISAEEVVKITEGNARRLLGI